jgi:hypothetical protein
MGYLAGEVYLIDLGRGVERAEVTGISEDGRWIFYTHSTERRESSMKLGLWHYLKPVRYGVYKRRWYGLRQLVKD